MTITDPTAAPTIDGPALLDTVCTELTRRVPALTEPQADAVTLWIAASHAPHVWHSTPLLVITGPPTVGKTRLLYAVADLSDYSMITNAHAPNLRRTLAHWPTTVCVDDATDRLLSPDSKTMRLLRQCTRRRHSGEVFAMAALATQADPPAALAKRALVIRLRPSKTPPTPARGLRTLAHHVTEWLSTAGDTFPPLFPADVPAAARSVPLLPLLDIADHAGGDWPNRARAAAMGLTDTPVAAR